MTEDKAVIEGNEAENEAPAPVDNLFALKLVVVSLGVLLVVCAITFFILLFLKGTKSKEVTSQVSEMSVNIGATEKLENITVNGRELILHIEGEESGRIVIVNPYTAEKKAIINLNKTEPQPDLTIE